MDQLIALWTALDFRRRFIVIAASLAMFAAVFGLTRLAATPNMALLYSGLENGASGDVVAALEQRAVEYQVRGRAIYVPAPRRDELRMTLASEGLPATGTAGYELLDTLSGFGTTSQMFDAAYWRAKEGELARTILSSPQIRTARVHIGRQAGAGLRREIRPTASVTVTATNGALSAARAKSLKFLVGSAVSGLLPENVSIIDGQTGQVFVGDPVDRGDSTPNDRASALKENVERLLAARVGAGRAIVEVAVEITYETESITERRFDPDGRVAISTETVESTLDTTEAAPGVTVASNLPTGDAGAGAGNRSQNSQTTERTNYEVSETQREILRTPGAIQRLTVAVLVDGVTSVDANGQSTTAPRSAEELADLRELVASAVGFDEARGDVIAIRSMIFEPVPEVGTEAAPSFLQSLNINVMAIIRLVLLGVFALGIGMFVLRPIVATAAEAVQATALPAPKGDTPALTGEIDDRGFPEADSLNLVSADGGTGDGGDGFSDLASLAAGTDPVERLRKMIEERQDETVDFLRGWMEKDGESA